MHAAAIYYRIISQQTLDCKTYSTVCFEIRNIFFPRRCMRIENFVLKAFSMIAAGTNRFRFSRFQKRSDTIILKLGETTREKQRSATRISNHISDCNLQQKIPGKAVSKIVPFHFLVCREIFDRGGGPCCVLLELFLYH